MLNNLKSEILKQLMEKKMTAKELDSLLKRPEGYTLWMIENGDIRRYPFNDEDNLAKFLGISTKKITELNGHDAYEKNNEYITTLTSSMYNEVKVNGVVGWESLPGKLSIYLRSCDFPGDVRDTEVCPIENEEYEVIPANHRTLLYYSAGPVYRKRISEDFSVLITKSFGEKIDAETFELTNPILCSIYLTDAKGHLIDYIEVNSEFAFVLKQYQSYLQLSELYDILHDDFDDEDYYTVD